jgi:hypothetical protein
MLVAKSRRKIEGRQTGYPPQFEGTPRLPATTRARIGAAQKMSRSGDTSTYSMRVQKIIGLYKALRFEGGAA